jgi:hypothetical protein
VTFTRTSPAGRAIAIALALALAGCPIVPDARLMVTSGSLPLTPGSSLSLALSCKDPGEDWVITAGDGHCGGSWFVDKKPGGSRETGTIDSCGRYTAPAMRPAKPPVVVAYETEWGTVCYDCCAAEMTLTSLR